MNLKNVIQVSIIAVLAIAITMFNPFDLEGVLKIWYLLPFFFIAVIVFIRPVFGARQTDVPVEDIRAQAVKSILRHVLTALTAVIALQAAINVDIPYVNDIFEFVKYLLGQTDEIVKAIMTILSFATVVYGFIKQGFRYENTAKAITKGRKYPGL